MGLTALRVAVAGSNTTRFVSELVNLLSLDQLEQPDDVGNTPLHCAAAVGNTEAAKILVKKNPRLPQLQQQHNSKTHPPLFPLHLAAAFGNRDTFLYLLPLTKDESPSPFMGNCGICLILYLVKAKFTDIALDLLMLHPNLADDRGLQRDLLAFLAQKPSWFASGSQLGYWQRLIYQFIPIDSLPTYATVAGDIKTSIDHSKDCLERFKDFGFLQRMSTALGSMLWIVNVMFWNSIMQLVPAINRIHDAKLIHMATLELVKLMCAKLTSRYARLAESIEPPLFMGIKYGIHELVREIIKSYPLATWSIEPPGRSIFQAAVLHRQDAILSLICQMGLHKHLHASSNNGEDGNVLHCVARLKPSSQVSCAALQMQRELQWFKVVETLVPLSLQEQEVDIHNGVTPKELFTLEHAELAKEGEAWMKNVASSCLFVAAIIVVVVFAVTFTVPGGNRRVGQPLFVHKVPFTIFAISNALALFFSCTSVLMFLAILTSRYSQEGFLVSLPRTMIVALVTLFLSIAAMLGAFGVVLHIVLVDDTKWVLIPVALVCFSVTFFTFVQSRLLFEILVSTYRPSILQLLK